MASMGDIVTVKECRPISKSKSWMLVSEEEAKSQEVPAINTEEVLEETE